MDPNRSHPDERTDSTGSSARSSFAPRGMVRSTQKRGAIEAATGAR